MMRWARTELEFGMGRALKMDDWKVPDNQTSGFQGEKTGGKIGVHLALGLLHAHRLQVSGVGITHHAGEDHWRCKTSGVWIGSSSVGLVPAGYPLSGRAEAVQNVVNQT